MFFKCILNRQLARTVVSVSRMKTKDRRLSEQRLVRQELLDSIDISWYKILENEFSKEYFKKLIEFIADQREKRVIIYPPLQQVFTFTRLCQPNEVKVVILGQDPYHQPNQAHGLSFSVPKNVPIPPSLQNIFKEVQNDLPNFIIPKHGTLFGWARQGVLLLNTCLTVEENRANSHKNKGWEIFTDGIIQYLNQHSSNLVFILWGRDAQMKAAQIDKTRHHVLIAPHPSPLSASRGFLGCKHFSQANVYLKAAGIPEIDWSQLPSDDSPLRD
ncbi:unnamed protein product [Adineta ricciae]|uniref:Uracil-DNA glycosylase n=2 Tax=Adineta ricciae TaxID=249248 RepID=A0A814ZHF6_ADIRI|nr:unnamed protein product [Adineta ricciae]